MHDLLAFYPNYRVVVCRHCQYAIVPKEIAAHLRTHYKEAERLTNLQICVYAERFATMPCDAPATTYKLQLPADVAPVPFLALYRDGFSCRLCPATSLYVCRKESTLKQHVKVAHHWSRRHARQSLASQGQLQLSSSLLAQVAVFPIACQTFY
jgi:hypothetical protein